MSDVFKLGIFMLKRTMQTQIKSKGTITVHGVNVLQNSFQFYSFSLSSFWHRNIKIEHRLTGEKKGMLTFREV